MDVCGSFNEDMYSEQLRLNTFTNFNCQFMTKEELALNGFFYTNQSDQAECAYCHERISEWQYGDLAKDEHRRFSENCPFVRGEFVKNIPIDVDAWRELRVENSIAHHRRQLLETEQSTIHHASYTNMRTFESRMTTYAFWPQQMKQTSRELAQAGLFYTDFADCVKCFSCAGEISDFGLYEDDVFKKHASLYPECRFICLIKGRAFHEVIKSQTETDSISMNNLMQSNSQCLGCEANNKDAVYWPCAHLASCMDCAETTTYCPHCGLEFSSYSRVYIV